MERRNFLKLASATVTGLIFSNCTRQSTRPNLMIIIVDDLGYGDLSSYGATDLQTPNIDKLIDQGCKFTNFYANCPVCSPTRASVLTGRYQDLVGVPGVIRTHRKNSWGNFAPQATMPSLLQKENYQTACIGKWHLGLQSPNKPNERGFDCFKGFLGDMMDDYYTHLRDGNNYMRMNNTVIDPQGHATDLFSNWACEYLENVDQEKPFFMYLAYNAPHTPIQPPEEWLERVKQRENGIDDKRAKLVALIEHMDAGIGQVMAKLAERRLDENTIVMFVSDNGGQIRVGANNANTRLGKGTLYEGGIKVPASIRWTGQIPAQSQSNRIALTMDIMPTLLQAASVTIENEIDGESFLETALGNEQLHSGRDLFWGRREGPDWWFKNAGAIYAVRRGDWKLLQPRPEEPYELYNLQTDPLEENNLAKVNVEKYHELKAALDAQLAKYAEVPWQPQE